MESVDAILDAYDVPADETTAELSPEEFATAAARDIDGGVAAVVYDIAGRVLLVRNDWSEGWIFPGGGVEPGEAFDAAAAREVREETGVDVTVERPRRVERQVLRNAETGEELSGEFVLFEASASEPTIGDELGEAGETIHEADWFEAVPDESPRPDRIEAAFEDAARRE